ncbi:MAG: hypothetical protein WC471_03265 [Candidatus Woesearchaeota archaeon]
MRLSEKTRSLLVIFAAVISNITMFLICYTIYCAGSSREHAIGAPLMSICSMSMIFMSMIDIKETWKQRASLCFSTLMQCVYLALILYYRN